MILATPERFYTRKELAAMFPSPKTGRALTASAVKRWQTRGVCGVKLTVCRVGGLVLIRGSDFERWRAAVERARGLRAQPPPSVPRERSAARREAIGRAILAKLPGRG
jgi:hypothetical protein